MNMYTKELYMAARRVLRYLQGTRDYGLLWKKHENPDLPFTAYADADIGSAKGDRKSFTGLYFK
ncbi:hypothetical protein PHMEG_00026992 [Phytophthora megakarya]|uniref:Polyprotein n=1 Tax=Phytophthora megakarya TaxID=4795 RepID=A0A225V905_9STRA|nr:hypothetical protein PHMEG_00026992 [Phytophthora megakarya]